MYIYIISIYLSTYLSIYPSIYLPIYLSIHPSIYPSIFISISISLFFLHDINTYNGPIMPEWPKSLCFYPKGILAHQCWVPGYCFAVQSQNCWELEPWEVPMPGLGTGHGNHKMSCNAPWKLGESLWFCCQETKLVPRSSFMSSDSTDEERQLAARPAWHDTSNDQNPDIVDDSVRQTWCRTGPIGPIGHSGYIQFV